MAWVSLTGWLALPFFLLSTFVSTLYAALNVVTSQQKVGPFGHRYPNSDEANHCPVSSTPINAPFAHGVLEKLDLVAGMGRRLGEDFDPASMLNQVVLAFGLITCICLTIAHTDNRWIRAIPSSKSNAFSVKDVRGALSLVPFLIVVNLGFNFSANSMLVAFPAQACQMDTRFNGSQLNGAFFTLANAVAIIVLAPFFEEVVYPFIVRVKGSEVQLGQKLIAGMALAALGNIIAAILERQRRQQTLLCDAGFSECAPDNVHMRDLSAFWMFVPFAIMGAAELVVYPAMYEYSYAAAPLPVRSLMQAFNVFFQGAVSNAFSTSLLQMLFPDDLDSGHLERYYVVNALCTILSVIFYLLLTRYSVREALSSGSDKNLACQSSYHHDNCSNI